MYQLSTDDFSFPDPSRYHPPGGLVACGGGLEPGRVLTAYQLGIFPWYNPGEEILWWCPDPRFVLYPAELNVSKSMRKILRREEFRITYNQNFAEVLEHCRTTERPGQDGSWLHDELMATLTTLHRAGIAQSVEVWQENRLVGGLYGLRIGRVFCGESMFAHVSNASKAGVITVVQEDAEQFDLIDCQIHSAHLESLGARHISKMEFLQHLPAYQ